MKYRLRILQIAIAAQVLVLAGVLGLIAIRHDSTIAGYALSLAGRREACSLWRSMCGLRTHMQAARDTGTFAQAIREVVGGSAALHLWDTPQGRFWIPGDSDKVLPVLLGQQAANIYGRIRPGDVVLDCGAHIGVFTRRALAMGARLVVAIEPAPDNVECLRRNFAAEIQQGRVAIVAKGVWDKEGVLRFHKVRGNSAGDSFVLALGSGEDIPVALTTIDRLVPELKLERVDFIKMDIKGAERQALEGARQTLARFRPRLAVAAEHLPGDPVRLPQLVRAARSDYQVDCSSCYVRDNRVSPEVLVFN